MARSNISSPAGRRQYIHDLAVAAQKTQQEQERQQQNDKDIEFRFGANLISKRPKKVQ